MECRSKDLKAIVSYLTSVCTPQRREPMKSRTFMVLALAITLAGLLVSAVPTAVLADPPEPPPTLGPTEEVTAVPLGGKAKVQSCYSSAERINRSFKAHSWTGWYNRTTTANCVDLNVAVTNHICWVRVDAQYYSRSEGRWIDGAHDDVWMEPGYWLEPEPIQDLLDGTPIRVRFLPYCTDSKVTLWLAY
jgi:hypothetical protein